ncbi:MAG: S9 family peptidase [Blastocatellia bacterium]|nr:S9 family peptidase [Blastocatellia bacterium]
MRNFSSKIAIAFCLLLALFISSAAQEKTDRLTAMDAFNLEFASDPQISPDGKKIIYVRRFSDIKTDRTYSNLRIINFDGSDSRPLTTGNRNDSSPRWSPDGDRIIYISDEDGSTQIYMRWMDTGQTARLTNLQYPPSGIAWSPDGKLISFTSFVPERPPQVARIPSPPPGAKWAEPATVIDKLVYRFNGPGYLKPGYTHLFVVPSEGGTPRQISSGNYHHGGPGFRASEAVWTPDGKHLIMSVNRRDDYELEPLDSEVYEFSLADGSVKSLTDRRGPDGSPAVSPDGKRIAYLGFDDKYQGYQVSRLYVMNRDGSDSRLISANLDRDVSNAQWATDASGIYFTYDDQGNTKLAFYSLDGKMKQLTGNLGGTGSAYSGGAFSVGKNGAFAFTYTRPNVPSDIAVATYSNPSARVITSINADLLAGKRLGEVEEIWYESSHDKRKIHGWIIKPPDFNPSKKYPLILEIHGGPFADYGDRFDFEKQVWAAKGYVVLYTNPRGSTSYGAEFGNLIHHNYPGDDFYDLNSGVDAVIAKGYIDTGNLFVTGGSGGGVLTCWMIGRTDRFRAAVTVYPVINWYSFVLTADISAFVAKYWFPGMPWDNVEHYEKRSLLSVVKNVKTPTMILTGEEDYRTPMSESEQYFQALKLLGVEAVLVRVPGEPHGIRRRPSHWMAKIENISGWMDKHKKNGP